MPKRNNVRPPTRWWRYIVSVILRLKRRPPEPPSPIVKEVLALGPYRESDSERADRIRYEKGLAAITHFNTSCPRGIILQRVWFKLLDGDGTREVVRNVSRHGTKFMMSGDPFRSWSEFCCQKELQDLEDTRMISHPEWRKRWEHARQYLCEWMIES